MKFRYDKFKYRITKSKTRFGIRYWNFEFIWNLVLTPYQSFAWVTGLLPRLRENLLNRKPRGYGRLLVLGLEFGVFMTTKIVQIIPLVRLPWNAPFSFIYLLRKPPFTSPSYQGGDWKVHIGTIVRIPFRHRNIVGVVSEITTKVTKKPIKNIHSQAPYLPLPSAYLKFCLAAARETLNHPARFMIPNVVHTRLSEEDMQFIQLYGQDNDLPLRGEHAVKRPKLLWWQTYAERDQAILDRTLSFAHAQHLVLTPTLEEANILHHRLTSHGVDCVVVKNKRTRRSISAAVIRKLLVGEPMTVIGQRSALFLPFTRLAAVTIDDEEHPSYKQEAPPPRYHVRKVIELLGKAYNPDILYLSKSPSVETFARYGKGVLPYALTQHHFTLVDLTSFHSSIEPFSPSVLDRIKQTIEQKKTVLVLAGKRGYAPILRCRDCRYIFRCPTCGTLLAQESKLDDLRCMHCSYTETVPPLCPQCHGPRLSHLGFGEKRIIEYLRTIAPSAASPYCLALPIAFFPPPLSSLGLIVVQNADPLLTRISFTASERAFHTFFRLITLAREHSAELLIQTSAPNHSMFKQLHEPGLFYRDEIAWRKQLRYPPFGSLISIALPLAGGKYKDKQQNLTERLRELLKSDNIEITELIFRHRRKKPVLAFTLKIPHVKLSRKTWSKITRVLKETLPGNAVIDVDPDRL